MFGRAIKVVIPSPVVSLIRLRVVIMPAVLRLKTMFIVAISGAMTAWLALPMPMALALPPPRVTATARRLSPLTRLLSVVLRLLSVQAMAVRTGRVWAALFPQHILALLAPYISPLLLRANVVSSLAPRTPARASRLAIPDRLEVSQMRLSIAASRTELLVPTIVHMALDPAKSSLFVVKVGVV